MFLLKHPIKMIHSHGKELPGFQTPQRRWEDPTRPVLARGAARIRGFTSSCGVGGYISAQATTWLLGGIWVLTLAHV